MWLGQSLTFGHESFIIQFSSVFRKIILQQDFKKPPSDDVVFINVNGDKDLIEVEDGRKLVITNRRQLARFFQIMKKHQNEYRYILCDILFEDPSPDDALLKKEIEKIPNLRSAVRRDPSVASKYKIMPPLFSIPYGQVEFLATANDEVYKFSLLNAYGKKSLPLLIYEDLHRANLDKKGGLYFLNNQLTFNSIVLDYKIRNHDLLEKKQYKYINLYQLLNLLQANETFFFEEFLKNRMIVLGDFEEDYIETVFGNLSGSLLLYNVYWSLVQGETLVPYSLVILLILAYSILSYFLIFKPQFSPSLPLERFRTSRFTKNFAYFLCLFLLILGTYFVYNIHLNILILLVYIEVLAWFVKIIKEKVTLRQIGQNLKGYFILPRQN